MNQLPAIPSLKMEPHRILDAPLGIYFDYPAQDYHDDTALGSSDIGVLSFSPADWWWKSKNNPLRPKEKSTDAKTYGSAVHKIVLEGKVAFEKIYGRKMLNWATKDGREEKASFEAMGMTPLDNEDYQRALTTELIIRNNPVFSDIFEGGLGNEVSVFWRNKQGIKKKARFDRLKQKASIDIKNVSNERRISFPKACLRKIDEFHWHIQSEHYREGRLTMADFAQRGLVYGAHDPDMLELICGSTEFAWIWLFVQSSGAPLTWSRKISYRQDVFDPQTGEVTEKAQLNAIYSIARARIDRADQNYLKYINDFGLEVPWMLIEPIEELHYEDLPSWFERDEPM